MRHEPVNHTRPELLRAAKWRAARYGLEAELIDAESLALVPARGAVEKSLAFLQPSLEEHGEWEEVSALVRATAGRASGPRTRGAGGWRTWST